MTAFGVLLIGVSIAGFTVLWWSPGARKRLRRCLEIDTRSLALFRIALGLLIVVDVVSRMRNFELFYTEAGVVPRELAVMAIPDHAFSVFLLSTDPAVTAALFVLLFVVGVLLAIGYQTRFVAVAALILVASLQYRNVFVLSYADRLFALLLFWGIFLPLGERWSIDSLQSRETSRHSVAGLASALVLLQVVLMYFVNGIHKTESELWRSGEATLLIFGLDDMTFLLADALRQVPELLQIGGLAWYHLMLLSPALIILTGRARAAVATAFILGHLAFAATVRIGAFPYAAIAGLVLFIQSPVWTDASPIARSLPEAVEEVRRRVVSAGKFLASSLPEGRIFQRPERSTLRHGIQAVLLVFLLLAGSTMTVSALQSADVAHEDHDLPYMEGVETVMEVVRVDQPSWRVFAPNPRTTNYYYVFPAETTDGTSDRRI